VALRRRIASNRRKSGPQSVRVTRSQGEGPLPEAFAQTRGPSPGPLPEGEEQKTGPFGPLSLRAGTDTYEGFERTELIGVLAVANTIRSSPMSALSLLRTWRRTVHDQLLPELHGPQLKALATSLRMTLAALPLGRVGRQCPREGRARQESRAWEPPPGKPAVKAVRQGAQWPAIGWTRWQGKSPAADHRREASAGD